MLTLGVFMLILGIFNEKVQKFMIDLCILTRLFVLFLPRQKVRANSYAFCMSDAKIIMVFIIIIIFAIIAAFIVDTISI